ncbi:MAG: hypothetical protein EOP06_05090 [Proteobacteria bacterium]|nr:MAG: hypothetical protein EOP06_05090 [Pseudomonadota bacterium]
MRIPPTLNLVALSVLSTCLLMASAAHAQNFVLYGATSGGGIYEVDPVAKTSREVANFGSNINGLAWVPDSQRLYFSQTITQPGDGGLYYWDRATGAFSSELLSASALQGDMDNGSYYNGAIWYVDGNGGTDSLFRLDLGTLATTTFANFDGTARTDFDFGDLVITESGQAYGYATDRLATGSPATFFSFSVASGSPTGYTQQNVAGNYQLGINLNDTVMYGTGGVNVGTGNWFVVDPATGTGTDIANFTTPTFTDLSGRGAIPAAAVVPEANTLMLAFPALGMVGTIIVRRRNKKGQN